MSDEAPTDSSALVLRAKLCYYI